MRQCLCSDYIRDQAAGFFFSSFESSYALYSLHVYLGDLLILLLCDDTILALRYIHMHYIHTVRTYIFTYIYLAIYIYLSVCLYLPEGTISLCFFFFLEWNGSIEIRLTAWGGPGWCM